MRLIYTGQELMISLTLFWQLYFTLFHFQEDDYFDADSDRSYAFNFAADGYDREENADAEGNVVGSYSYVDETGELRDNQNSTNITLNNLNISDYRTDF